MRSFLATGRVAIAEYRAPPRIFLLADPYKRVHIHQYGVASGDRQSRAIVTLHLIARVEKQLVGVSKSRLRCDARVRGSSFQADTHLCSGPATMLVGGTQTRSRARSTMSSWPACEDVSHGCELLLQAARVPERRGTSRPFACSGVFARFLQKCSSDWSPPNSVVKMVESANRMSPARLPSGGIQRNILNSRFPASVKGCGCDRSIGCLART